MNEDDDLFGWPNNSDQKDETIILNWEYFKELLLGMLVICITVIFLIGLIIVIKLISLAM